MKGFRLSAVLRARKAAEDSAKMSTVAARAEAKAAADIARTYETDLDEREHPDISSPLAFAASLSARQATASALSDALNLEQVADQQVDSRMSDLRAAAARRKAIERLAERHAEQVRREEERSEQDATDDLTGATHHRTKRPR